MNSNDGSSQNNGGSFGERGQAGPNLADFDQVSQTIMVADANTDSNDFKFNNSTWNGSNAQASGGNPALFAGHLSTMNVLFADGHVKSMKPLSTISSAMGGGGNTNMWSRTGKDFPFPDWNTNALDKLVSATNKYK